MNKISYANVVGSLMFVMICTQFDLANLVSLVSRFMSNPGEEHCNAVKCILMYIKWTINVGLVYGKTFKNDKVIKGYVDVDYTGDLDERRS